LPGPLVLVPSSTARLAAIEHSVYEVERHLHNWERWFGLAGVPNLPIHAADRIGTTVNPFILDAGNNTWGAWVQILGSGDTPADPGNTRFDPHRVEIVYIERTNTTHFIQLAIGTSGAAAITAGTYTEFVFRPITTQGRASPIEVLSRRATAGDLMWARIWAVGQDTGLLHFFMGIHEYTE
jgi:hypothetical protein